MTLPAFLIIASYKNMCYTDNIDKKAAFWGACFVTIQAASPWVYGHTAGVTGRLLTAAAEGDGNR